MGINDFEKQLSELEKIISSLEKGELSLNDSLEEYKKGITIIKSCNEIINLAENEVKELSKELNENE